MKLFKRLFFIVMGVLAVASTAAQEHVNAPVQTEISKLDSAVVDKATVNEDLFDEFLNWVQRKCSRHWKRRSVRYGTYAALLLFAVRPLLFDFFRDNGTSAAKAAVLEVLKQDYSARLMANLWQSFADELGGQSGYQVGAKIPAFIGGVARGCVGSLLQGGGYMGLRSHVSPGEWPEVSG